LRFKLPAYRIAVFGKPVELFLREFAKHGWEIGRKQGVSRPIRWVNKDKSARIMRSENTIELSQALRENCVNHPRIVAQSGALDATSAPTIHY